MRLLLDECLPRKLKSDLPGHEVRTAPEMGWASKENGELLELAKLLNTMTWLKTLDLEGNIIDAEGAQALADALPETAELFIWDNQVESAPWEALQEEKKNSEFVRSLIAASEINACHDISDGGIAVALFEMCNKTLGCEINLDEIKKSSNLTDENQILFAEDQSRYLVALDANSVKDFRKKCEKQGISPLFFNIHINIFKT